MPDLALLQSGLDVHPPSSTPTHFAIAVGFLAVVAVALAVVRARASTRNLPVEQTRHRSRVREQRHKLSPAVLQYRSARVASDAAPDIAAEAYTNFDAPRTDRGFTGVRGLISAFRQAIGAAWGDRVGRIPRAVRRAAKWAVALATFGTIATAVGIIVGWLRYSPGHPTPEQFYNELVADTQWAIGIAADVVWTFPYSDLLFALGFAYAFQLGEWLFWHWYVLAGALVAAAITVWLLDRSLGSIDATGDRLVGDRRFTGALIAGSVVAVWIVGAGTTFVVQQAGFEQAADPAGFVLAALLTAYLAYRGARYARYRLSWSTAYRYNVPKPVARKIIAAKLAQRAVGALAWTAAGFVGVYVVAAVANGNFERLAAAFATADPRVQAGIGLAAAAFLAIVAWNVRSASREIRSALGAAMAETTVRGLLLTKGIPVVGVAAAYVLAYSVIQRIGLSLLLAALSGFAFVKLAGLVSRARYATNWSALVQRPAPHWVTVLQWVFVDADGHQHYYAEVNGHRLSSADRRQAADAIADAVKDVAEPYRHLDDHASALETFQASTDVGEPSPTQQRFNADYLMEYGIADPDDARTKVRERVRKTVWKALRKHGPRMERTRYERLFDAFPDGAQDRFEREHRPYIRMTEQSVAIQRDPYADHARRHDRRTDLQLAD